MLSAIDIPHFILEIRISAELLHNAEKMRYDYNSCYNLDVIGRKQFPSLSD